MADERMVAKPSIDINERIIGEGDIVCEYTFTDNEDETIVVYWERNFDWPYAADVSLVDESGQMIPPGYLYSEELNSDEWTGRHLTFDLRRVANGYLGEIAQGQMTVEDMGFDPVVFEEAAIFAETGRVPAKQRDLVEQEI